MLTISTTLLREMHLDEMQRMGSGRGTIILPQNLKRKEVISEQYKGVMVEGTPEHMVGYLC